MFKNQIRVMLKKTSEIQICYYCLKCYVIIVSMIASLSHAVVFVAGMWREERVLIEREPATVTGLILTIDAGRVLISA
uniref:Secreted protein n=1 Tax=Steinernema glaseri TaxID=37863 RepID=A0A1I8A358_9BILA